MIMNGEDEYDVMCGHARCGPGLLRDSGGRAEVLSGMVSVGGWDGEYLVGVVCDPRRSRSTANGQFQDACRMLRDHEAGVLYWLLSSFHNGVRRMSRDRDARWFTASAPLKKRGADFLHYKPLRFNPQSVDFLEHFRREMPPFSRGGLTQFSYFKAFPLLAPRVAAERLKP